MNVRAPHVVDWLQSTDPDVLVLQEIKQVTEKFPAADLEAIGYHTIASGQKTYNGVAVISKQPATDAVFDFPRLEDPQRRILASTVGDIRVIDLYIPNGSELGSEKYEYKLKWLAALQEFLVAELQQHEKLVVLGDFNIAPADADVHDPEGWGEATLCSPKERKALTNLLDLGLTDVFRKFEHPEKTFSWWDYRAAGFRRNAGLRIDLILTTAALTERCTACYVDKEPRAWDRPSDHAPVVAEFDI